MSKYLYANYKNNIINNTKLFLYTGHEGSEGLLPLFPNFGSRWWCVVNFVAQRLYLRDKNTRHHLIRRLGGPQSYSGRFGEQKDLNPFGNVHKNAHNINFHYERLRRKPTNNISFFLSLVILLTCLWIMSTMNSFCWPQVPVHSSNSPNLQVNFIKRGGAKDVWSLSFTNTRARPSVPPGYQLSVIKIRRSRWPRGLRRGSAAVRLLGLEARIETNMASATGKSGNRSAATEETSEPQTSGSNGMSDASHKVISCEKDAVMGDITTKKSRVDLQSLPTRQYLDQTIVPILLQALSTLAKERPPDPINFLAGYLLKHKTQYEQSTGVSPAAGQWDFTYYRHLLNCVFWCYVKMGWIFYVFS